MPSSIDIEGEGKPLGSSHVSSRLRATATFKSQNRLQHRARAAVRPGEEGERYYGKDPEALKASHCYSTCSPDGLTQCFPNIDSTPFSETIFMEHLACARHGGQDDQKALALSLCNL